MLQDFSAEQALFDFINNILNGVKKNNIGGIFFDLQTTFDCGNHDILLNKLGFYGITGGFFSINKNLPTKFIPESSPK